MFKIKLSLQQTNKAHFTDRGFSVLHISSTNQNRNQAAEHTNLQVKLLLPCCAIIIAALSSSQQAAGQTNVTWWALM